MQVNQVFFESDEKRGIKSAKNRAVRSNVCDKGKHRAQGGKYMPKRKRGIKSAKNQVVRSNVCDKGEHRAQGGKIMPKTGSQVKYVR